MPNDNFKVEKLPKRKQRGEWITVRMRAECYDKVRDVANQTNQQISHIAEKAIGYAFDHLEIIDFKEGEYER
ncbi:hypothetical protein [Thomasclavelia cocleata]|uniref:hypothetical protein n=1 Tax=Thomasclavelia cocleata TaxID=69824 RepID=UPI00242B8C84|nr:hypothetical protein [Thomasclavelia cocleata]